MKNLLLFFCVFYCLRPDAQSIRNTQTGLFARTDSYSSHADAATFQGNPASIAGIKKLSTSLGSEKRFLLNEISNYRLTAVLPSSGGNFAIALNYFGAVVYSEIFSSISYARRIGKIDFGAQFNHFLAKTSGYNSSSTVNFEFGFIYHLTEQIHAGAHIYNPIGIKKSELRLIELPVIFSAGIGYEVSEIFFAGFIIEKENFQPLSIDVAVKYVFAKSLFARLGLRSGTSALSFGTGVQFQAFRFELLTSIHPQLGITPALMIVYNPIVKK
ncbi:MAG: hypothetical protein ACXWV9_05075 [Flavisolibacter sp.]